NLYDPDWRIYSRNFALPPQFIADGAKIENSIITEGCYIEGTVIDSLLSNNVRVEKGAVVKDTIIFANTAVEAGATVNYAIIDENVTIKKNAVVGAERGENAPITLVAHNVTIGEDMTVPAGEIIEKDLVL
ncbi:MAG: glucose-1-phosphate adenylyltransferase, partial [Bacilli bacterium]